MRWILRKFGFLKVEYGFSCGRNWVEIDGKVIAQVGFANAYLADEDVSLIVDMLDEPNPDIRARKP